MSQKSKGHKAFSRQEMEIHKVLSPASGRHGDSVSIQRTPPPAKTQPQLQTLPLGDLSFLIKESVVSGVQQGLGLDAINNLCKVLEKATANKILTGTISNSVSNEEV